MVTFCWTMACGSLLSTVPWKVWSRYASTRIRAGSPDCRRPMSVSSTMVRTCTSRRSAILRRIVPPVRSRVPVITCPSSTVLSTIVPVMGALSSTS